MNIFYVDDSGDQEVKTFTFLKVDSLDWNQGLNSWLNFRFLLKDNYKIPIRNELHAIDFLHGRGNPSLDIEWNRKPRHRLEVANLIFKAITELPITVQTFYAEGKSRHSVYRFAVNQINQQLVRAKTGAVIVLDGDGSDPVYRKIHRFEISEPRNLIEDPWFQESHTTQWLIISDLIAHVSFQKIKNNNLELRKLYDLYVQPIEMNGEPIRV